MIEDAYISYFESLASNHAKLAHGASNRSFFLINNPHELTEFDNAIKNNPCQRVLLLDMPTGYLTDNGCGNYTQHSKIDFMVVGKASAEIQQVRADCFAIGMDLIAQIRFDQRKRCIVDEKQVYLQEESIQYDIIGPLNTSHYGYLFSFHFCAPFAWQVNSDSRLTAH